MSQSVVSELKGDRLNAAVAVAIGGVIVRWDKEGFAWVTNIGHSPGNVITCPNYVGSNGYFATELIEKRKLSAFWDGERWRAGSMVFRESDLLYRLEGNYSMGDTKIEACMRHLVTSTLGESINL